MWWASPLAIFPGPLIMFTIVTAIAARRLRRATREDLDRCAGVPYYMKRVARRYAPWACGVLALSALQYAGVVWITKSPMFAARQDVLIWCMLSIPIPSILLLVVISLATRELRQATKDDRERCASCGYSAQGLEVGPRGFVDCPECGGRVKSF